MTRTTFNSLPYTSLVLSNSIFACILSMNMIHMPWQISQCMIKKGYNQYDTVPLLYFRFLRYFSTNGINNFLITCLHMLVFLLFSLSYRVFPLSLYVEYGEWCNQSTYLFLSDLNQLYILDTNLFLRLVFHFPNTISGFEIWFGYIFQNYIK